MNPIERLEDRRHFAIAYATSFTGTAMTLTATAGDDWVGVVFDAGGATVNDGTNSQYFNFTSLTIHAPGWWKPCVMPPSAGASVCGRSCW